MLCQRVRKLWSVVKHKSESDEYPSQLYQFHQVFLHLWLNNREVDWNNLQCQKPWEEGQQEGSFFSVALPCTDIRSSLRFILLLDDSPFYVHLAIGQHLAMVIYIKEINQYY